MTKRLLHFCVQQPFARCSASGKKQVGKICGFSRLENKKLYSADYAQSSAARIQIVPGDAAYLSLSTSSQPIRSGRVSVSSEQWWLVRRWSAAFVWITSRAISRMATQSSGKSVWLRPE